MWSDGNLHRPSTFEERERKRRVRRLEEESQREYREKMLDQSFKAEHPNVTWTLDELRAGRIDWRRRRLGGLNGP